MIKHTQKQWKEYVITTFPWKKKQNKIITLNEQKKEIKGKKEWNNE